MEIGYKCKVLRLKLIHYHLLVCSYIFMLLVVGEKFIVNWGHSQFHQSKHSDKILLCCYFYRNMNPRRSLALQKGEAHEDRQLSLSLPLVSGDRLLLVQKKLDLKMGGSQFRNFWLPIKSLLTCPSHFLQN